MMGKKATTRFVMSGQLGNQLFQLMAALLYGAKNFDGAELEFKDYKYSSNETSCMLTNIQCALPFVFPKQRLRIIRYFALKSYVLAHKNALYRKIRKTIFKDFFTSEIGYAAEFSFEKRYREVHGYFQTYLIPKQLQELGSFPNLEILNPTKWYLNMISELRSKSVLVIHVRRGDYYQFRESIGILTTQYYYRAAKIVYARIQIDETWIFTNDTEEVKNTFDLRNFLNPKLVVPPTSSHPMESLLLMSNGRGIVIANSSYSWWSAYIASHQSFILAPRKWYKGILDPKDLIPPDWTTLESDWMN